MKKDVKIMVGCRVEPDLKEVLETEATQNAKTLSAYIEGILKQRHFAEDDVEKLKERIFELETQNAALQSRFQEVSENENVEDNTATLEKKVLAQDVEIRTLKKQKMEVTDMYKRVVEERNVLTNLQGKVIPHWISNDNYNRMVNYLKQLKELHSQFSHEQLLVVSLGISVHNESSFMMNRMSHFLKRNPNFFNNKKIQNT